MPNRPGRLKKFSYIGFHSYFLTICTERRQRAFSDLEFAYRARDQLLRYAVARRFSLLAYCLMPDHVHLLAQGRTVTADLRSFILGWNTWTAYQWRRNGCRLWQTGYYDHVLRDDEAFLGIARYIIVNPVRAGLVNSPDKYPSLGSTEYSIAEILQAADEWLPVFEWIA